MNALHKLATEGGSWELDVYLAGVMKSLCILGQFEGKNELQKSDYESSRDVSVISY